MKNGKIGPVLTAVIEAVAGVLLIVFPTASAQTLSYASGGVFVAWGLITVVLFFLRQSGNPNGFAHGLFQVALGLFMVFRPELIGAIMPYLLAFVMLMGCCQQLQAAVRMRQAGSGKASIAAILGAAETALALLLIAQVFGTGKAAYILQGVGFVAVAVIDTVTRLIFKPAEKK